MANLTGFINSNKEKYINELKEFLRYPSISTNPENRKDVEECADYVKRHLQKIGMENVKVMPTGGHPVVYADWLKAGADKPTILIYGHYDVQPVDPVELWTTPPFEADIRGENIYARGSADDKGQVFIHLKALEAHFINSRSLPVNIKIIVEGEEEIGSINLGSFLEKNKEFLKCDVVVISDTAMYDKDVPAIGYALRGLCYMQVEVIGPNRDLHSGQYGGSVENPINALANMITKLKDDKGRVLIAGFYDDVLPISEKEKAEFARLPFSDEKYMKGLNVNALFGEEGYTTLERIWSRPTLDCNGIWGGFTGKGAKTVLPSKAFAKISMRLVPNQEPDKIEKLFTNYINKIAPKSVKVNIYGLHHGKAAVTPIDSKWIKAAFAALKQGFGKEPVFIREGGSIPIVVTFKEVLGADTVLLGFGLPDENAHSPDEHLNLNNFHRGIITTSIFYNELANLK
ncbi:MAG TPA: dipeptidase [Ignavibacteria bacterium]|jgi:acetylornithine deacetylase/succinyl-diaminopimelate desuccinylase-like protein